MINLVKSFDKNKVAHICGLQLMLPTTIVMLLLLYMMTEIYKYLLNNLLLIRYLFVGYQDVRVGYREHPFKLHTLMLPTANVMLLLLLILT